MASLFTNPLVDWMDYEGQLLAERLYQAIVVVPSVRAPLSTSSAAAPPRLTPYPPPLPPNRSSASSTATRCSPLP